MFSVNANGFTVLNMEIARSDYVSSTMGIMSMYNISDMTIRNVSFYNWGRPIDILGGKKAYALQRVSEGLGRYGIKLTEEEICSYIEGTLKDIKTSLTEDDKTW